jgi:hypothetical protein
MMGCKISCPLSVSQIRAWSIGMRFFSTQHKLFWLVFLTAVSVCFVIALSGLHRHRNAGRTADILRPMLASDTRFQKVVVALATNARVYLEGSVNSAADLEALHRLVEQTKLPSQPAFSVRIDSNPPN